MKIREIFKWIIECEMKFGRRPSVIPISKPERMDITSDYHCKPCEPSDGDKIFGLDVGYSPWAEMTRVKMLEIGVERFCVEKKIDERAFKLQEHRDYVRLQMVKNLTAYIFTDVTHLDVSFDWDRLAWLKRKVEWIGKRWPVKRKTARIEGKVLYPYLKIQAPADTHRVRFVLSQ